MYNDPTDTSKRKPRRLRGTPANRFTAFASVAFVGTFCLIFQWYTSSEAEWVQANKRRVLERFKPTEESALRREVLSSSIMATAVIHMKERQADREAGIDVSNDPDESL